MGFKLTRFAVIITLVILYLSDLLPLSPLTFRFNSITCILFPIIFSTGKTKMFFYLFDTRERDVDIKCEMFIMLFIY